MAKDILALYDPCQGYVERFIKYASEKNNIGFEIQGYTDLDILEERLDDYRIKAVLLSGEEIESERRKRIGKLLTKSSVERGKYVFLLGEQSDAGDEEEGSCHICKYQSMDQILEDISAHIGRREKNDKNSQGAYRKRDLQIYGIYTPWDKMSHPEAAAHIAGMIRKRRASDNIRILYLNLEPFSGMGTVLDRPKKTGISDIIYYYKTRPENMTQAISQARGRYAGMDVLTAPDDPDDLNEIDREEWPGFLETISGAGDYQYIILDISDQLVQLIEAVLQYGRLFIPALPYSGEGSGFRGAGSDAGQRVPGNEYLRGRPSQMKEKMQEFRSYIKAFAKQSELEKIYEIRSDADR